MKYSDIRIVENKEEYTALVITNDNTEIEIPNIPKSEVDNWLITQQIIFPSQQKLIN